MCLEPLLFFFPCFFALTEFHQETFYLCEKVVFYVAFCLILEQKLAVGVWQLISFVYSKKNIKFSFVLYGIVLKMS